MSRGSARLLVLAAVLLALLTSAASSGGAASTRHHRSPFAGLGTWVDVYAGEWADPEAAVAAMAQHHVRTLYLETGNYSHVADVFRPDAAGRFIDAAHAAGIRVVAWYLPSFANLKRDARKALAAIDFRSASGERFDGFALDIEATTVRSLPLRDRRLLLLSARIRHAVSPRYPLGAITPSPVGMSQYFWPDIPYRSLTRYYKAFLPMAYSTLRGVHGRAAHARVPRLDRLGDPHGERQREVPDPPHRRAERLDGPQGDRRLHATRWPRRSRSATASTRSARRRRPRGGALARRR